MLSAKNMASLDDNLISDSGPSKTLFLHRQLKYMDKNIIHRKTSYTVQDLWAYFILSFNYQEASPLGLHISKEDLKTQREKLLETEKEPDQKEIDFIYNSVNSLGLDVVLFSIDEIVPSDSKKNQRPSILSILDYAPIAITNVKRLILEERISK